MMQVNRNPIRFQWRNHIWKRDKERQRRGCTAADCSRDGNVSLLVRQSISFTTDRNILYINTVGGIAMNFSTDIHVPQRRNPTDFGDQPTFFLKPVWVPFSGFGEVSQQLLHRRPEVQPCGDTNIIADSCRVLLIQRYSAISFTVLGCTYMHTNS